MRHHWTDRYVGLLYSDLDCFDLVQLVLGEVFYVELPNRELCDMTYIKSNWHTVDEIDSGDIIFFETNKAETHIALAIDDKEIIHSGSDFDCIVERFMKSDVNCRTKSIWRFNEQ